MKKWTKRLYTGLGMFFVGLGIIGVVVPVLPTTPFLLLALWFFAGSSERLHRWLLTNRVCGKYLSDYKCGRGISLNSKIYILALLWGTITYSALWAVDILWVKVMLFAIAGGVTVHILHIRTKPRRRRIIVLVPTEGEAKYFADILSGDIEVRVCGVGMAATAGVTARALADRPDALILAGIAGAYPGAGVEIGECVLVARERVADQGAFRGGAFVPLYQKDFVCTYAVGINSMRSVAGYTVNSAAGSYYVPDAGQGNTAGSLSAPAAVENMEGAAFFAVCEGAGVPYFEVRAVSNLTTDSREAWKLDEACMALAEGIKKLTDEIKA